MESQELKKVKKVAPYIRCGINENTEEKMYQYQEWLEQYINKNSDVEIKGLYIDINKSTIDDRPAFYRLMDNILEGKIDKVVVLGGISKLSRNWEEIEEIKEYVEIESVEPVKSKIKVTNLNEPINNLFNEWYLRDMSEKMRNAKQKSK